MQKKQPAIKKFTYTTSSGISVEIEAESQIEADNKFVEQLIQAGYLERSDTSK